MREDGKRIPAPSTLDELHKDPAMKGAVAFLVDVAEPEQTVRFTARKTQLSEIDNRANAAKLTRSAYLVQSALRRNARRSKRARSA
jgi:hypothetical protein